MKAKIGDLMVFHYNVMVNELEESTTATEKARKVHVSCLIVIDTDHTSQRN